MLIEYLPDHQRKAGDLGMVVMLHVDHAGHELKLFSADGQTLDVVTVEAGQLRKFVPVTSLTYLQTRLMICLTDPCSCAI